MLFQPTQLYVVLIRITDLNGMYLIGSYCRAKATKIRIRSEQPFRPLLLSDIQRNTLAITLLNAK